MNSKNKPNGHGALLANGSGANGGTISLSEMGRAASDDASELSVANAAASSAAARADREACGEGAQAQGEGKRPGSAGAAFQSHLKKNGKEGKPESGAARALRKNPPGLGTLPVDGEAFVDAGHAPV